MCRVGTFLRGALLLATLAAGADGALQYIRSSGGLLETTLRIQQGVTYIDGLPINNTITFNDLYPGPTLVARRGDRVLYVLVASESLASRGAC